jgi:hypothetical protein
LGKWGETYSETSTFDCAGFTRQSREFMQGVRNGMVAFGYRGQHTKDFDSGVRASDVVWLMQWLGRVSDDQLRAGLQASGANENETACLSAALRDRIEQLRTVR